MEKKYRILKTFMVCCIGVFIGRTIYQVWDYKVHPDIYEFSSAPWYTGIQVNGIFTAVVVGILLILLIILKKKMK